eukprot:scaffold104707_cov33-Tisochrysis_lutea.AAC.3
MSHPLHTLLSRGLLPPRSNRRRPIPDQRPCTRLISRGACLQRRRPRTDTLTVRGHPTLPRERTWAWCGSRMAVAIDRFGVRVL